jgi:hypothetical protein
MAFCRLLLLKLLERILKTRKRRESSISWTILTCLGFNIGAHSLTFDALKFGHCRAENSMRTNVRFSAILCVLKSLRKFGIRKILKDFEQNLSTNFIQT